MALRNLPPLQFLPAFEAAGRTGSFTAAAAELHVTPSAVSQQIKSLESALGIALFERRKRTVVLTTEGDQYWNEVRGALLGLSDASARMRRRTRGQELRVSSIDFVVYEFIMPRLASLRARLPGVDLRLESGSDLVDFDGSDIDCAIRVGGGPWPGLVTHDIGTMTACGVCSPAVARRVRGRADLLGTTLIEQRGHEHQGLLASLKKRDRAAEPASVVLVDSLLEMLLAAEQGLGVGWGLFPLATRWVLTGRVAVPFPHRVRVSGQLTLVHRPDERRRELFRALALWLRDQYEKLPQLPAGRIVKADASTG